MRTSAPRGDTSICAVIDTFMEREVAVEASDKTPAHRPLTKTGDDLDLALARQEGRVLSKALTFSYGGTKYCVKTPGQEQAGNGDARSENNRALLSSMADWGSFIRSGTCPIRRRLRKCWTRGSMRSLWRDRRLPGGDRVMASSAGRTRVCHGCSLRGRSGARHPHHARYRAPPIRAMASHLQAGMGKQARQPNQKAWLR
jgi:hypothetical protein